MKNDQDQLNNLPDWIGKEPGYMIVHKDDRCLALEDLAKKLNCEYKWSEHSPRGEVYFMRKLTPLQLDAELRDLQSRSSECGR